MVLDAKIKKQICDFVYTKPRVVDEVAKHLGKNWRTADRYIQKIAEEDGCISTRTFREGTRGALKIVFWSNIENIHSSSFQERLLRQIESSKHKDDFDFFDIYQYVDEKNKNSFLEEFEYPSISIKQNLVQLLRNAENELYIFSGNLSWTKMTENNKKLIDILEELAERNVKIRVVCRVDFASLNTLKDVYAINNKIGKEIIEIRHTRQPLRGFVIDGKTARFKDEKLIRTYKEGELLKNTRLFMEITDTDWIEWLTKVFYNMFRNSMDGRKRIEQLGSFN
ncbi:hypothetical protein ACFL96_17485 [Thermoproteota archaeon]